MTLLIPLTRLLLDSRDAGLFFGAPLGALLLVLAALLLPESKGLQRVLMALLGFASLRETINFLGGGMIFSRAWLLLGKRRSSLTRLLLYPALLALLLLLGRKRLRFDRRIYEERIRESLGAWISAAIPSVLPVLFDFSPPRSGKKERPPPACGESPLPGRTSGGGSPRRGGRTRPDSAEYGFRTGKGRKNSRLER